MITDVVLLILTSLIGGIALLLPAASLPSIVIDGVSTALGYLYTFDYVIPVDNILLAVQVIIIFELTYFSWTAFNWFIRKLPFMN